MVFTPNGNGRACVPPSAPEATKAGSPTVTLLSSASAIQAALEDACAWAESFVLCTPALDSDRGRWPLWLALRAHIGKLERAYVALEGLRTEPAALHDLHATGALRLVPAADGSFRANLLRFRRGTHAQIILGAGMLCPPGLMASVDAMVLWEGPAADGFALRVERLLEEVRLRAHVPDREGLGAYAEAYFAGQEVWGHLVELGAPFIRGASRDADLPELELIEDAASIRKAMKSVRDAIIGAATLSVRQTIGFQGGTVSPTVHWVAPLSLWGFFQKLESRYWNAFGVERPSGEGSLSITVEINPPLAGIDRRVGGAFARDPATGDVYLLHRGRIGGGQKGIGAELFWRRFRGGIRLRESGREEPSRVVVVGKVGAPEFLRELAAFVHEVGRIKSAE